jgi:glycosyltransferase involved in cell wall biosynthesis
MKILQLGKYYPPFRGGIETVVKTLSEELTKLGDSVTVLCANDSFSTKIETQNQVRVIRLGRFFSLQSQPILISLAYQLWKHSKRNSILHFHSPNPLLEFFSLFIRGKKVVTYHADVVKQRNFLPLYRLLRKMFLRKADAIVVASEAMKNSEGMKGFSPIVIPFGISPLEDSVNVEKIREQFGNYILFVGRLVSYKGLPFLLEAVQKTKSRLLIIGSGPEESSLKQKCKELDISNQVFFLADVHNDQLRSFYRASDFFVLPSVTNAEAYGMVLLEAMSCGKALISTNLKTGVREVNEDGVTGLVVEPKNANALALAIDKLSKEKELKQKLENGALRKFQEKYSSELMATAYRKIYEQVLNA